jgi:transcriptional regulator with XRE-family HTH domain
MDKNFKFAKRFLELRVSKGISQRELARMLGTSVQVVKEKNIYSVSGLRRGEKCIIFILRLFAPG